MTQPTQQGVLAQAIEGRLRVSAITAKFWAEDLLAEQIDTAPPGAGHPPELRRCNLSEAHEAVKAVSEITDRPVMYGDLKKAWRSIAERSLSQTRTDRLLGSGGEQPDPEVKASIARVAAALAFSGGTRGRDVAEVREQMRTLYREPQRVQELLSGNEDSSEEGRRAKAARLAAAPVTRPHWYESEEQIRARVGR